MSVPAVKDTGGRDRQATPMPTDMNARELGRWTWRQVTSMRTALVLLLLLALAAIPGSIVPQEDVDSLGASRWRDAHPNLTPVYEKLGLFSVYDSVWFSAVYILLMISLVGCILPRTRIYWRAMRARPPKAPRNLARLPESRTFTLDEEPSVVLERTREMLRRRRYRVEAGDSEVAAARVLHDLLVGGPAHTGTSKSLTSLICSHCTTQSHAPVTSRTPTSTSISPPIRVIHCWWRRMTEKNASDLR